MNDSQYNLIAEDLLLAVEEAIEDCGVDIDYEGVGGLLTLTFKNTTKIIINKQAPLHEIWVATKFNGHHFTYADNEKLQLKSLKKVQKNLRRSSRNVSKFFKNAWLRQRLFGVGQCHSKCLSI